MQTTTQVPSSTSGFVFKDNVPPLKIKSEREQGTSPQQGKSSRGC